ncbi:nucleotidyl transferase AbiEii/AbiGii toxin family protein [Leucobacter sp. HY1910]
MNLSEAIGQLHPKDKAPNSARVLNTWIAQAERRLESDGGRLGWLVASTVVAAALQQAVDTQGRPYFLLKGGTLLQHRLPQFSRATTDLDGLIRGDIDNFLDALDKTLAEPFGPLQLRRDEIEIIRVPHKVIKPRRFDIVALLNGQTWRRMQVEISPDEGNAGEYSEPVAAPSLAGFGLPSPDHLAGLSMRYQIAQKVHAVTDPHNPPAAVNDRARDVVDLLLLRSIVQDSGYPAPEEIRAAITDTFDARASEAITAGGTPRPWPAKLTAYPHWATAYASAANSARFPLPMAEAVTEVNNWLEQIESS